jgi:hypothetical protein
MAQICPRLLDNVKSIAQISDTAPLFDNTSPASKMTATTRSDFNDKTEALEVAEAFNKVIHDKTVLITGVNRKGIGFTTAEAFVSIWHVIN